MALGTGVFESSLAYRGIELPARAACFWWRARERHNFRVTHPECIEMGDMEPISNHIVLHCPRGKPAVARAQCGHPPARRGPTPLPQPDSRRLDHPARDARDQALAPRSTIRTAAALMAGWSPGPPPPS